MSLRSTTEFSGARVGMLVLVVAWSLIASGCAKSDTAKQATEVTSAAPASGAAGATGKLLAKLPVYPGAASSAPQQGTIAGKHVESQAYTSSDSFDKVYKWYQAAMPAQSETSHEASQSQESAVFTVSSGTTQQSVSLLKTGGVEVINITLTTTKG